MKDPLSSENLDDFFQPIENDVLLRRESSSVEFKTEFDWKNKEKRIKYIKSMVAFANSKGGSLIFGIGKNPHTVEGCEGFEDVDSAEIANEISNYFHCEVVFQKISYQIANKIIGIINIQASEDAPVICTKICHDSKGKILLNESGIYYRYSAKSDLIRAGDLVNLISRGKEKINQKWMASLSQISSLGIQNIGILDTESGLLKVKDSSFLLDSKLLQGMKVVNKYSEKEDGEPGLRIIGEIEGAAKVINRNKTIEEHEIIQEYLERTNDYDYHSVLERLPNLSSFSYPFLYFLNCVGKSVEKYSEELLSKPKFSTKTPFIEKRVNNFEQWFQTKKKIFPISKNGSLAKLRGQFYEKICKGEEVEAKTKDEIKALCQTFFHLDNTIDVTYLRNVLLNLFRKHYYDSALTPSIREACCALEQIEFIN